jgi:hypothetical protein
MMRHFMAYAPLGDKIGELVDCGVGVAGAALLRGSSEPTDSGAL